MIRVQTYDSVPRRIQAGPIDPGAPHGAPGPKGIRTTLFRFSHARQAAALVNQHLPGMKTFLVAAIRKTGTPTQDLDARIKGGQGASAPWHENKVLVFLLVSQFLQKYNT
ncbi:hypothetical protein DESPIG_02134 [Desulfovibrio piger ATCC 29098]|uniref:Uncharacterized protein n=1 Tax=Desulfovibrio piger ATCC 29098 TaxID=411464 RepID=B6WVL6_9BACT|nr:hypothetical protein DESPIG_02134 [Desulfovibrio piger ATCC 29098]